MLKSRFMVLAWMGALVLLLPACAAEDDPVAEEPTAPADDAEDDEEPVDEEPEPEHDFADGDEVTIVLGSSAGGGFDIQARAAQGPIQTAFEEVLGVDVTVVVENMPGAAHRVATEFVNRAEPDGKTILFSAATLLTENQVLEGADYDLQEMTGIGSAGTTGRAIAVRSDLDLAEPTLEALAERSQTQPVLMGHPGIDGALALLQILLEEGGITLELDPASVGQTAEIMAAMLRGDVEAGLTTGVAMQEFVDDNPGELEMLVNLACEPEEGLEDVPTIVEQDVPNAEEICVAIGGTPRVFVGPPGVSDANVQAWNEVLEAALSSDEYRDVAAEAGLAGEWSDNASVDDTLSRLVETFTEHQEVLREHAGNGG